MKIFGDKFVGTVKIHVFENCAVYEKITNTTAGPDKP
jgi:hypothetical protein